MAFTPAFVISKTIIVLVSILVLIYNPKLTIPILLVNIGVAVAESAYTGFLPNAALGMLIFWWVSRLRYDDTSRQVPAMILLYTLWNFQFHWLHVNDAITALSHTLIPAIVALGVYNTSPEYTLRIFLLARLIALTTHALHYASPKTCHSEKIWDKLS
jgi:hypothetical protein